MQLFRVLLVTRSPSYAEDYKEGLEKTSHVIPARFSDRRCYRREKPSAIVVDFEKTTVTELLRVIIHVGSMAPEIPILASRYTADMHTAMLIRTFLMGSLYRRLSFVPDSGDYSTDFLRGYSAGSGHRLWHSVEPRVRHASGSLPYNLLRFSFLHSAERLSPPLLAAGIGYSVRSLQEQLTDSGLPPAKDYCSLGRMALISLLTGEGFSLREVMQAMSALDTRSIRHEWERITGNARRATGVGHEFDLSLIDRFVLPGR